MKKWVILGLVAAVLIGAIFYFKTLRRPNPSDEALPEGMMDLALPEPVVSPQTKDIVFTKTLAFSNLTMSIDGGPFQGVSCSKDRNKPMTFGFISLDEKTKAHLVCISDYLGGISISYTNKKGEWQNINLAMADGDAGEAWDTRTWITKNEKDGSLQILSVTLASSNELDNGALQECNVTKILHTWDGESKIIDEAPFTQDFDLDNFSPPINVSKDCLDEKGRWKR